MASLFLLAILVFIAPFVLIALAWFFGLKILFASWDSVSYLFHRITRGKFR